MLAKPIGQHELQVDYIEAAAELVADLYQVRDVLKAQPLLERNARCLLGARAADHRMKPGFARPIDQLLQQQAPEL